MEIWKPIVGYETLYEISTYGRVRSHHNSVPVILKPGIGSRGYKFVSLCKNGSQKTTNIHRLVATHFIPNPDNLPCINHKDENRQNNEVSNLEWCTYYYNNVYGQRLTKSALKRGLPVKCIETGIVYPSASAAQRETGIHQSYISMCCNHKRKKTFGFHWEFVKS